MELDLSGSHSDWGIAVRARSSVTYRIGKSTIEVIAGDITTSRAQVIVSSDGSNLSMGGGVSAAIHRAAGKNYAQDAHKMTPRPLGDVVVTSAGELPARYVMHVVTLSRAKLGGELPPNLIVRHGTQRVLELCEKLSCSSVAFPAIGAGAARISYEVVAAEMGSTLLESLLRIDHEMHVELYLLDRFGGHGVDVFKAAFERSTRGKFGLTPVSDSRNAQIFDLTPSKEDDVAGNADSLGRLEQIRYMIQELDARRSDIESQILEAVGREIQIEAEALTSLKKQLIAVNDLRSTYESELNPSKLHLQVDSNSVFVSSTSKDLGDYRDAVRDVISKLNKKFVGMEDFAAESAPPADMICRKVEESQMYLGILGMKYGYIDKASGFSMTELEYRQAVASSKDIRIFVMKDDAPITADMVERSPEGLEKLNRFRETVLKMHSCGLFGTREELTDKVAMSLEN